MKINDNDFLLINLYNANKESEQLNTISTLCNLLDDITDLHCKNIILGGDFNIFFNPNPKMKNKSVALNFLIFGESEIQRKSITYSDNSMSLVSFEEG